MAWLSLDEGDNDPRRFLSHLLAALRTTGVGAEAAQLLETAAEPPVEAVLTSIVNGLDQHEEQAVIVLDDDHVIESPEVHRAVNFLLDHLPPHAGLAIATRADPPLPLPGLRARGELVELRAADLRFTPGETDAFLTEVMGLHLTPTRPPPSRRARRDGSPGCSWRHWPFAASTTPPASSSRSPAATGSSLDYLVDEVLRRRRAVPDGRIDSVGETNVPALDASRGLGWVINLAVAEWVIRRSRVPAGRPRLRPRPTAATALGGGPAVSSTYQLRLGGHLEGHWSTALGAVDLRHHADGTSTLTVRVADQAQLHGVLAMLRDIGALLLSLRVLPPTRP